MMYEPVQGNRLFAVGLKYSHVDWKDLSEVLDAFEKRITDWYLLPIRLLRKQKGQHGAFAAMSTCCLLVDCLCQFDSGKVTSNRTLFTDYVRKRLPNYDRPIVPAIQIPKPNSHTCQYDVDAKTGAIKTDTVSTIADALYYIYRCGILHSAHAPLCGVIAGLKTHRFSIRKKSLAKYAGIGVRGADCPVVVIDPWKLFDDVEAAFNAYLATLRAGSAASPTLRANFNVKFAACFGIDIATAK